MDRYRRQGANGARPAIAPPASSRLTVRKLKNRRRPGAVWSRVPRPRAIADACGRALRRSLPAVAAVVALAVVGGIVWAAHHWMTTSSRFAIAAITIEGSHRIDPDEIRAQLPVRVGDNVFVDLARVAGAVRAHPWIAGAEVHRRLPNTLVIEIREHAAAAVLAIGELYLVDAAGRPFKRAAIETGEAEGLPLLTGIDRATYIDHPDVAAAIARDAIAAFERWRGAARPAIGEIHVDSHRAVTLHTRDRAVAIQLGALGSELAARMRTFDTAWAALSDDERTRARAVHVDARPDHVTVAFAKD
jgi:cell division protein FtsQ